MVIVYKRGGVNANLNLVQNIWVTLSSLIRLPTTGFILGLAFFLKIDMVFYSGL